MTAVEICPDCDIAECKHIREQRSWKPWYGGEPPVANDAPVVILWPNGLSRTYERGDHIVWRNLKPNGSVRWKLP